jgi:hypothetical protein
MASSHSDADILSDGHSVRLCGCNLVYFGIRVVTVCKRSSHVLRLRVVSALGGSNLVHFGIGNRVVVRVVVRGTAYDRVGGRGRERGSADGSSENSHQGGGKSGGEHDVKVIVLLRKATNFFAMWARRDARDASEVAGLDMVAVPL